ncbi:hypothetical protein NE237_004231 [Protea cynaroides]|uniref:Uncharacterized protein n=1 Tax=Protea cynaroides TaxID=273540 RepID=A0A9Q0KIH3_9MAGN|nr:hypothetical protein NE237_004231 [Protea cynaroides]
MHQVNLLLMMLINASVFEEIDFMFLSASRNYPKAIGKELVGLWCDGFTVQDLREHLNVTKDKYDYLWYITRIYIVDDNISYREENEVSSSLIIDGMHDVILIFVDCKLARSVVDGAGIRGQIRFTGLRSGGIELSKSFWTYEVEYGEVEQANGLKKKSELLTCSNNSFWARTDLLLGITAVEAYFQLGTEANRDHYRPICNSIFSSRKSPSGHPPVPLSFSFTCPYPHAPAALPSRIAPALHLTFAHPLPLIFYKTS